LGEGRENFRGGGISVLEKREPGIVPGPVIGDRGDIVLGYAFNGDSIGKIVIYFIPQNRSLVAGKTIRGKDKYEEIIGLYGIEHGFIFAGFDIFQRNTGQDRCFLFFGH